MPTTTYRASSRRVSLGLVFQRLFALSMTNSSDRGAGAETPCYLVPNTLYHCVRIFNKPLGIYVMPNISLNFRPVVPVCFSEEEQQRNLDVLVWPFLWTYVALPRIGLFHALFLFCFDLFCLFRFFFFLFWYCFVCCFRLSVCLFCLFGCVFDGCTRMVGSLV